MKAATKVDKTFDCVEFKRSAQLAIYEDIQGMTHEQERAYFERQAERSPVADWWKRVKAAQRPGVNRNTLHKKLSEYGLEK
jgi:transcriptional regulator of acetoin/glycerol metabolism